MLGGCSTASTVVKSELRPTGRVANVFSSALATLTETAKDPLRKKVSVTSKVASYPPLPNDADAPRVRRFIRHYAYEQRETMRKYLDRAVHYLPMVQEVAREHGLPEDIGYLFMLESGANPEARSPANALGMWQFMPATARSYGLRVDRWVDERLDPRRSTEAAMLYLKDLYGMFGCWRLALSAYNSGENKLNKVLCAEDASEYDEICSSPRLKRETREFFPRFQAMALIAKNTGKYGFSPLRLKTRKKDHEIVEIRKRLSLKELAWAAGVPYERLAEMNPALFRKVTPSDGPPFELRVPQGRSTLLARKLETLPTENGKSHIVHIVDRGDNVSRILRRYHVSRSQLAGLNPDVNFRRSLRAGERILIPVGNKAPTRKDAKRDRLSLLH
ncbi:MAG: transglycosylase SLT domain-containing protein [Desulfomonilaceae bacterium]|nr:transglycosylase SLT domain-containing protein [Desulfomonilaceae bacterium]